MQRYLLLSIRRPTVFEDESELEEYRDQTIELLESQGWTVEELDDTDAEDSGESFLDADLSEENDELEIDGDDEDDL